MGAFGDLIGKSKNASCFERNKQIIFWKQKGGAQTNHPLFVFDPFIEQLFDEEAKIARSRNSCFAKKFTFSYPRRG